MDNHLYMIALMGSQKYKWYNSTSCESPIHTIIVSWYNNSCGVQRVVESLAFSLHCLVFPDIFTLGDLKDFLLIRSLSEVLCIVHI